MNIEMFQPDPVMVAYLVIVRWGWVPFVSILALVRTLSAAGAARAFAALSLAVALAALAFVTLPALGLYAPPFLGTAATGWGGLGGALTVSAPLLISALLPGRRWWALDVLHLAGLAILLGLALWTSLA